jgi:hypothetical protein
LKVVLEHVRVAEDGGVSALAWAMSESRPGVRHGMFRAVLDVGCGLRLLRPKLS